MRITENQKQTLKLSATGIITVLLSGIAAAILAPNNQTGQIIKFTIPLLTGLLIGGKIYLRQLKLLEEKLEE